MAGNKQLGNTINGSVPVISAQPVGASGSGGQTTATQGPGVTVTAPAPVRNLNGAVLRTLGAKFAALFARYASDRNPAEQKWLRNLRQYLGIYDPEVLRELPSNRSRAYPRITRMKCVSMLSRLMNLMFPGNEDNWELRASPSPEMSPENVAQAVQKLMQELQAENPEQPLTLTQELVDEAVRTLAAAQAAGLTKLLKDQLAELGGKPTSDWIALNRKVVDSGIKYGIGVLEGPYVRKAQVSGWMLQANPQQMPDGTMSPGQFQPVERTIYKPQYDFLPVWDFYPDMSARDLPGEGYFKRKVIGRSALRKLADRPDFFGTVIKEVLTQYPSGNYKAKSWENDLKTMGLSAHAESQSTAASGREKYEIIIWKGPVSAKTLAEAGADVPEKFSTDDVDAELWIIDNFVIKAEINAWRTLDVDMQQVHIFCFDEDDSSPVGQGLPGIVRDSQMSICAATRMALDNASVTCGPNLEVNTALMMPQQDLSSVEAYKIWYRDDADMSTAQFPAVRQVTVDGHLAELQSLTKMFLDFAEMETFIGGATGGDMQRMPSEPMRTASGASMLRSDAALPFKDIVRNFDSFTQTTLWSLVLFNKKYNPDIAPEGDYNVIPRGATSLIAKEVRGTQIDMLSQTLTPEERDHVDERKFVEAKFAVRDLEGMLVSPDEADRRKSARAAQMAQQQELADKVTVAGIRKTSAEAYKNVSQGQKNVANAQGTAIKSAFEMIDAGEQNGTEANGNSGAAPQRGQAA
jgi:hypothetical protein